MRRVRYTIYWAFIATLLLSACADNKRTVALLDRAESLMDSLPDSVYILLTACNNTIHEQSEKTRMRYWLLMAEASNKCYKPMPSDSLFMEVVDYYDSHGTANQQLKAHYLQGCIYRDREEAPMALLCYQDAVEKADTLSPDCDYNTLYKVYGQMADVLDAQYLPNEELEAQQQYCKYAQKAHHTYHYIRGIELQVRPFFMMGDTQKVLEITEKSRQLYEKYGMKKEAASVYPTAIHIHLHNSNYKKAHELMTIFEEESGLFDTQGNISEGREQYYYSKGLYYLGIHQADSAEAFFRKLYHHGFNYDASKGLLAVFQTRGNADSIAKYAQLHEEKVEDILAQNQMKEVIQSSGMYNYTRFQKQAAIKNKEAERERLTRWGVLAIAIFLLTFLLWRYKAYRAKKAAELRRMEVASMNLTVQLMKANEELSVMRDSYNEFKDHALALKEREIEVLKAEVEEYQQKMHQISASEKEAALLESDKVKLFKRMADSYHQMPRPSDADWEQLAALLQHTLPLFYTRIASEERLTTQEMRVAVLTRLNFSPNELAILLEASSQRITNLKEKVNRRLFQDESAKTLYKNLKNA